jgi:hypothetical protein
MTPRTSRGEDRASRLISAATSLTSPTPKHQNTKKTKNQRPKTKARSRGAALALGLGLGPACCLGLGLTRALEALQSSKPVEKAQIGPPQPQAAPATRPAGLLDKLYWYVPVLYQ